MIKNELRQAKLTTVFHACKILHWQCCIYHSYKYKMLALISTPSNNFDHFQNRFKLHNYTVILYVPLTLIFQPQMTPKTAKSGEILTF